jgi:hypothetical protein
MVKTYGLFLNNMVNKFHVLFGMICGTDSTLMKIKAVNFLCLMKFVCSEAAFVLFPK